MNKEQLNECVKEIWDVAELRFKEVKSAEALASFLESEGFKVTRKAGGIDTAFTATWGSGKPHIGLLAEFDALSGLSQEADCTHYKPRKGTDCGHGCGHHLLGGAVAEAVCLLKETLSEDEATITFFGCPGEEGGSGKAYMARAGLFDDLDCAFCWHPSSTNAVSTGSSQANIQAYFHFHGVSAHAAGSPHLGRSALDAVELMNVGVNYLREHMESTDRIHYAIVNAGGKSPNVVQAEASVLYLIRSTDKDKNKVLYDRVVNIAKGAALMTETTLDVEFDKACSNYIPNKTLETLLWNVMQKVDLPKYTDEEIEYAREFKNTVSQATLQLGASDSIKKHKELYQKYLSQPLCDFVIPFEHSSASTMGSTDVSDVSWVVPTAQFNGACYCMGTPGHSWQLTAQGLSSIAFKGMDYAAHVLKEAVIEVIHHPEIIDSAKQEHTEKTEGKAYVCPIPEGINPKTNY